MVAQRIKTTKIITKPQPSVLWHSPKNMLQKSSSAGRFRKSEKNITVQSHHILFSVHKALTSCSLLKACVRSWSAIAHKSPPPHRPTTPTITTIIMPPPSPPPHNLPHFGSLQFVKLNLLFTISKLSHPFYSGVRKRQNRSLV